jgi:hypothetical protein
MSKLRLVRRKAAQPRPVKRPKNISADLATDPVNNLLNLSTTDQSNE